MTSTSPFTGNNVDIRLQFSQAVTVNGSPFVNTLVGTNAHRFSYLANESTSTQLVFRYTVVSDDVGVSTITAQNLNLNGSTIASMATTFVAADVGSNHITVQDLNLNGGSIRDDNNLVDAVTSFSSALLALNDINGPVIRLAVQFLLITSFPPK